MAQVNRFGLSRVIPRRIQREVRQRSKFGCVMCRSGFYQLEHIDPTFADAREHNPANICCLCGSCHTRVTSGQLSKAAVREQYAQVHARSIEQVGLPVGPLDFHDGRAELSIGHLVYSPSVHTVLRYHGHDLIKVLPGQGSQPGSISAVFTDDVGQELLWLDRNQWIGSLENWDIEVTGPRLTVRRKAGEISLRLRLDPPGRVVVERLDMRVGDAHVLATETTYAAGRYVGEQLVSWMWAQVTILASRPGGAAIEFATPEELARQIASSNQWGQSSDGRLFFGGAGFISRDIGVSIASRCYCETRLYGVAGGTRDLAQTRNVVFHYPDCLPWFLATGKMT